MSLDGRQLLAGLADGSLPPAAFNHRNHVHAAWQCLREQPLPAAAHRFAGLLRGYVRQVGAENRFHFTLTLAFMHLIQEARRATPDVDWDVFAAAHPELFDQARHLIARHYSPERLCGEARSEFVAPDRAELP